MDPLPSPCSDESLPVYIYEPLFSYDIQQMNPYVVHLIQWLHGNRNYGHNSGKRPAAVAVENPESACLFLVTHPAAAICNKSTMDCGLFEMSRLFPFNETMSYWILGKSYFQRGIQTGRPLISM